MVFDTNACHLDYAVVDKEERKLLAAGRINAHELQYARRNRREHLLHAIADKIGRIAKHFEAEVVAGKLNTGRFSSWNHKANRAVKNIPHYKLKQILEYKLPLKGIPFRVESEAHTTTVGKALSELIGLDVHKSSAISFALRLLDPEEFKEILSEVRSSMRPEEGGGAGVGEGSGLTAPCQSGCGCSNFTNSTNSTEGLAGDEAGDNPRQRLPGDSRYPGLLAFASSLKPGLARRIWHVKV